MQVSGLNFNIEELETKIKELNEDFKKRQEILTKMEDLRNDWIVLNVVKNFQ